MCESNTGNRQSTSFVSRVVEIFSSDRVILYTDGLIMAANRCLSNCCGYVLTVSPLTKEEGDMCRWATMSWNGNITRIRIKYP